VRNLVRSELRKVATTRMWLGLVIGGLVLVAFYVVVIALTAGNTANGGGALQDLADPGSVRAVYGVPLEIGYILPLILGVTMICGEFRHKTITPTFLATPRRSRVLAAKIVAAALIGLAIGAVFTVLSTALGAIVVAARGYAVQLDSGAMWRVLVLVVVGVAVWTIFGVGFGALLKNQIAAIVTALALVGIVEGLLALALRWAHLGTVAKFLPSSAANAILRPSNVDVADILPWWAGLLVLLAWGLGTALLGALSTMRRDIS
jgi:ABC-type transport system involved in multi-copper enzyme maturation permease subunit